MKIPFSKFSAHNTISIRYTRCVFFSKTKLNGKEMSHLILIVLVLQPWHTHKHTLTPACTQIPVCPVCTRSLVCYAHILKGCSSSREKRVSEIFQRENYWNVNEASDIRHIWRVRGWTRGPRLWYNCYTHRGLGLFIRKQWKNHSNS